MLPFWGCILILVFLYGAVTVYIHLGLKRPSVTPRPLRRISILVAARNEEATLPGCLQSLAELDYPTEYLDIWIVNDRSSDATPRIATQYCQQYDHFHLLNISDDLPGLRGKMNALAQGIERSQGEILLITDADCRVAPEWVRAYNDLFDQDTGMVAGMTLLESGTANPGIWERIQALDLSYLLSIAAGTAQQGRPVTVLGNNFGFRRSAYEEVGGFQGIGFSLTEDMKLMQAIDRQTRWKIRYYLIPGMHVQTRPLEDWRAFYEQRKRWIIGGRETRPWGYFLVGVSVLTRLSVLLGLAMFYNQLSIWAAVGGILLADASLLWRIRKRFNRRFSLLDFLLFEGFHTAYLLLFAAFTPFLREVRWKGRRHRE
ncbi:MAG: glycosyltransferase [Calditrichaeota bacterium]|nr:glycosyltransferase [Calditrichota bacterium]